MPRITRSQILYDGCFAHVISRSIRKEKVFKDSEDFELFLKLLYEVKEKSRFKIFHYCLMHTHFHLVVQIDSVQLFSKGLNQLKSRYIYSFHKKYRLSGPIWRERYKSLLIENERYLFACGSYVEQNPVKAGLVDQVEDWNYSSSQHYLNKKKDLLVDEYSLPNTADQLKLQKEEYELGHCIGSDFFKFQFKGRLK